MYEVGSGDQHELLLSVKNQSVGHIMSQSIDLNLEHDWATIQLRASSICHWAPHILTFDFVCPILQIECGRGTYCQMLTSFYGSDVTAINHSIAIAQALAW